MTNLEKLCKEVIEKGEAATERPWHRSWLYDVYPAARDKLEQSDNAQYIVAAVNNADKLPQACLIMREALEFFHRDQWQPGFAYSEQTLKKVEELFQNE